MSFTCICSGCGARPGKPPNPESVCARYPPPRPQPQRWRWPVPSARCATALPAATANGESVCARHPPPRPCGRGRLAGRGTRGGHGHHGGAHSPLQRPCEAAGRRGTVGTTRRAAARTAPLGACRHARAPRPPTQRYSAPRAQPGTAGRTGTPPAPTAPLRGRRVWGAAVRVLGLVVAVAALGGAAVALRRSGRRVRAVVVPAALVVLLAVLALGCAPDTAPTPDATGPPAAPAALLGSV